MTTVDGRPYFHNSQFLSTHTQHCYQTTSGTLPALLKSQGHCLSDIVDVERKSSPWYICCINTGDISFVWYLQEPNVIKISRPNMLPFCDIMSDDKSWMCGLWKYFWIKKIRLFKITKGRKWGKSLWRWPDFIVSNPTTRHDHNKTARNYITQARRDHEVKNHVCPQG